MLEALLRHDALLRAAIAERGGHVFKTVGDAFCAAFARAPDAVAALIEAQRALAAEDFSAVEGLRVRMAVHFGSADEVAGDYFGTTVNRVARLLAAGHGGQILVSGIAAALLESGLPAEVALRDLGEHRLKDLSRPERVFQVVAPGLATDFAPLRSLDALPNNLPASLTSFVGRERETEEITALIRAHRLVTLVGSGGVGKTRASLQVAANLVDGSGDGVWFVELAPLASGEFLPATIAQTLGLTLPQEGDPSENLASALAQKRALLVLDNCEHVVESAGRAAAAIVRRAPQIKILASSRQALGIAGEATYRLPSLEVPAAVRLFAERARLVDQSFTLDDATASAVADICRRLDGIPLAIELAAARVRLLKPRQLRERLDERFRILTGGARDLLPRQRTLRAVIDWSYDLLDVREAAFFRRLGIFAAGFTLEAAAAVARGDDVDEFEALDALAALVDKSMVVADASADATRYRLLESTRAYALEKLDALETGETRARHAHYFAHRFVALTDHLNDARYNMHAPEVESELENIYAALDLLVDEAHDPELGARLCLALQKFWFVSGRVVEAVSRLERALASERIGPDVRMKLLVASAVMARNQNDYRGVLERYGALLEIHRAAGNEQNEALTLLHMSACLATIGEHELARQYALEARPAFAKTGDEYDLAYAYQALGLAENSAGNIAEAEEAHRESLRLFERAGGEPDVATALSNLGTCALLRGDAEGAMALAREAIRLAENASAAFVVAASSVTLADALARRGQMRAARERAEVALNIAAEINDYERLAESLEVAANVASLDAKHETAAKLLGAAEGLRERCGAVPAPAARSFLLEFERKLLSAMEEGRFDSLRLTGRSLNARFAFAAAKELLQQMPTT
jgi:predicted ATPase